MQEIIDKIKAKVGKGKIVYKIADALLQPTSIFVLDIETHSDGDKKPGDLAFYPGHGIAGVSISNSLGDSAYFVVNDGRDYGGIPIVDFIGYLNHVWFDKAKAVILHNCKFDLSFLESRGMQFKNAKIVDTWILNSIANEGVFASSKLKDVIAKKFNIQVDTKNVIDDWLKANNTQDFGDIPVDLIGPYACDDVLYSLILALTNQIEQEVWGYHDRCVRNVRALNEAEKFGIGINSIELGNRVPICEKAREKYEKDFCEALGSVQLDIKDEQAVLKYLHSQNLHSPPRDWYGETKFVFDREFLVAHLKISKLVEAYYEWWRRDQFIKQFSGRLGEVKNRLVKNNETQEFSYHPSYFISLSSKGGIAQTKIPDWENKTQLSNEVRELFVSRQGKKLVIIEAAFPKSLLVAFYCQDQELLAAIQAGQNPEEVMAKRTGYSVKACSLLMQKIYEGSGNNILERRLKIAAEKGAANTYGMCDKFNASLLGYRQVTDDLNQALKDNGFVKDRLQRKIKIPEDKRWRALAILINSSYGSIMSYYFDLFNRIANKTQAKLVMTHEREFVYEVDSGNGDFKSVLQEVIKSEQIRPKLFWHINEKNKWESICSGF